MSSTVNQFQIIGYLGANPVMRYTPDGEPVLILQLATQNRWRDSDGIAQLNTEWHSIYTYRRMATIAHESFQKGMLLRVVGTLETRLVPGDLHSSKVCLIAREMKHLKSNFPVSESEALRAEPPTITDFEFTGALKPEVAIKRVLR